jgi:hypothetical protein
VAGPGLTGPPLGPAAHRVLEAWLEQLGAALPARSRLRARIVDELRDGLRSATEYHLRTGAAPLDAALAAVAEFGAPDVVAASFRDELTADLVRRVGVLLIATGPLIGALWLAVLVPPLWPPRPADLLGSHPLYLVVLATAVPAALLAVAATGPLGRWLPLRPAQMARLVTVAACACAVGDGLLLTALVRTAASAPHALAWPTALLAAAASIARLGLAARAARHCLTAGSIRSAARH